MLFFYYGTGDLGNQAVRLGDGFSFTEAAESGIVSMSRVRVDDPGGSLDLVGHHSLNVDETSCSWRRLFTGYFADRTIKRAPGLQTGVQRIWESNVYDVNSAATFEVIRGSTGKRPKETDTARLAWLLSSGFLGPISTDSSAVFGAGVDLDKADYRGQTVVEVMTDCAQTSGNNWFVAWDQTLNAPVLHYYDPQRAFNTCTIKISNVLSDVDMSTVFCPDNDWSLNKEPSRVYSGVYYEYGEKNSAEYRTDATVLSNIGHKRETEQQDSAVRTAAKADLKADKWLVEARTELETITVSLRKVPPSVVNLIRAGMRIQVKGTHLPGYTSYTYLRITKRTVQQDGETPNYYQLDLELANPKQGGTKRKRGKQVEPDVTDGSSIAYTRRSFKAQMDRDDCQGGLADAFTYGAAPPGSTHVESACRQFTPGIFVGGGCTSPATGYSGVDTIEQWLEITGSPSSDSLGIKVTVSGSTIEGVAASNNLVWGTAAAAPTTFPGAFFPLGEIPAAGGSFVVPRAMIATGGFIVIGPGWKAASLGNQCSDTMTGGTPMADGLGNSGSVDLSITSVVEVTIDGTGDSTWKSVTGTIDGSNRTFTLPGWNGRGTPRMRIGAVEYAAGQDYTVDADAGQVTFLFTPWLGSDIRGRWSN